MERVVTECSDQDHFGKASFLALPWGSRYMRIIGVRNTDRFSLEGPSGEAAAVVGLKREGIRRPATKSKRPPIRA